MHTSSYADRMFRWTLRETMDAHGVTRYALQKETGLAMNTVRAMYDGTPTRVDFPVIERVVRALGKLARRPMTAADVFIWETEKPGQSE